MTEQKTFDRIGTPGAKSTATGEDLGTTEAVPMDVQPKPEVLVAQIPGWDESKGVTLTLSHPLSQKDRTYLGLPGEDGATEVGQKVKVNKNGAKTLIGAGYATVDPEDQAAVKSALTGKSPVGENAPAAAGTTDTTSGGVEPGLDPAPVTDPALATEPDQSDAVPEQNALDVPTEVKAETDATSTSRSRRGSSS